MTISDDEIATASAREEALGRPLPKAVRLERLNDSIRHIDELMERWDNRLKLEGLSFAERYNDGRMKLIADVYVLSGGHRKHYHAIFWRDDFHVFERVEASICGTDFKVGDAHVITHRDKEFVLIHNVHIVNGPEGVIPSTVRLQRPYYVDDIWAGSLYFFVRDSAFKAVRIVGERKIDPVRAFAVEANEVACQEIERRPQVMDGITDEGGELGRDLFADLEGPVMPFCIALDHESVRFSCEERRDLRVEIRDVGFGPFNL